MLAQYSSGDSGAAVLGIFIALAVIGLQIYLIYAIIATRQDVKAIRSLIAGGPPSQGPMVSAWPTPPLRVPEGSAPHQIDYYSQDGEYYCRTCGFKTTDPAEAQQHRSQTPPTAPAPAYKVVFRSPGNRPDAVEQVLMNHLSYARSGARGAIRNPGQQILSTPDLARAQQLEVAVREAGGAAEIQQLGGGVPSQPEASQSGSQTSATPTEEMKTCPDCAEEVRAVARKCRFCGHMFDEPAAPLSS